MSLEAILEAISQVGQSEVRAIEDRAQEAIARIMAEAEREAVSIQQAAREAASSAMAADRARIIHQAQLEAMRIVGEAEQEIVEQALGRVRQRLATLRTAADYRELLQHLVHEALAALQGSLREDEHAHLHADPRDRALLDDILDGIPLQVTESYELQSWGGVRATSADQRVVVDNTLEARLNYVTPYLQRNLPALLKRDPDTGQRHTKSASSLRTS